MKCPHCGVGISWTPCETEIAHYDENVTYEDTGKTETETVIWVVQDLICPECEEPIMFLMKGTPTDDEPTDDEPMLLDEDANYDEYLIWPRASVRPCPPEVPQNLRDDFSESSEVLGISPKASAALSRRCLQHLLKDYAKVSSNDLSKQIDEVITSRILSSDIADQLDAVRTIGNFAAHTQKSTNSGEILDVEPEEAEWNLEVLEELFEHFFVKPERNKKRKESLNEKLVLAGKPQLP